MIENKEFVPDKFKFQIQKVRIENALKFAEALYHDSDKEERTSQSVCIWCWYSRHSKICGQGFTLWTCDSCKIEDRYPNTCVPRLCNDCAKNYSLCAFCSGDVNYKILKGKSQFF